MSIMSKANRWAARWISVGSLGVVSAIVMASCAGEDPTATPRPGVTAIPTSTATPPPGVTATPTTAPGTIKRGGSLSRGHTGGPNTFDPTSTNSYLTLMAVEQLYSQLLQNRVGTELECDLCESWSLEGNGTVHVFKLRSNATFQDGTPVRAKDVIYTLRKVAGEIAGEPKSFRCAPMGQYLRSIDPYETPDELTVKLHLRYSSSAFPKYLAMGYCGIIKEGDTSETLKGEPNGSGAFIIKSYDPGSHIDFEANPNYYKAGLPYLDTYRVPFIPDRDAASVAVLTGRVDKSHILPGTRDSRQEYQRFVDEGKGRWHQEPCLCMWGGNMNVTKPPLDNKKLRHAINLAMDRTDYTESRLDGRGLPALYQQALWVGARSPEEIWDKIPGWGTGAKKQLEIEQAKQLVIDAGFPNGLEVSIMAHRASYVEWLGTQLPRVGIDATLDVRDRADMFLRVDNREYNIFSYAWISGYSEPDVWISTFFVTGGGSNNSGYSNPVVDQLFLEQSSETDLQKRIQLGRQIEDIILADMPLAPLPDKVFDFIEWDHYKGYQNGLGESFHDKAEWIYDGRMQ